MFFSFIVYPAELARFAHQLSAFNHWTHTLHQTSTQRCSVMQVIAWANKSCDNGYPDTCLQWAGFLAKLAIHYDRVADGDADVGIMNRVSGVAVSSAAVKQSYLLEFRTDIL